MQVPGGGGGDYRGCSDGYGEDVSGWGGGEDRGDFGCWVWLELIFGGVEKDVQGSPQELASCLAGERSAVCMFRERS